MLFYCYLFIYLFIIFWLCWVFIVTLSSCGTWDLSSLIRDQTHIPSIGRQVLNHWTTREIPGLLSLSLCLEVVARDPGVAGWRVG